MDELDDIGDVSAFDKPTVPNEIVEAIANLVINTGASAQAQVDEDLDDLVEAVDMQHLEWLSKIFRDGADSDLIDALLASPVFRELLKEKVRMYGELLNNINFEDDGNL